MNNTVDTFLYLLTTHLAYLVTPYWYFQLQ